MPNENPNARESAGQKDQILAYMRAGNSITPLEAQRLFGCMRLGARIWQIIHEDHIPVHMEWEKHGRKKYARYSLPKKPVQMELPLRS